jgi:hypothetical protein
MPWFVRLQLTTAVTVRQTSVVRLYQFRTPRSDGKNFETKVGKTSTEITVGIMISADISEYKRLKSQINNMTSPILTDMSKVNTIAKMI